MLPREVVADIFSVSVPKRLLIQNCGLGWLLYILYALLTVCVIVYFALEQLWLKNWTPQAWKVHLTGMSPAAAANVGFANEYELPHYCNNPQAYWYNRSAEFMSLKPTGCRHLGSYEERWWSDGKDGQLFASTLVKDRTMWRQLDGACNTSFLAQCAAIQGYQEKEADGRCLCKLEEEFFVPNPEDRWVVLHHGFIVDTDRYFIKQIKGSTENPWDGSIELLTLVENQDGESCTFGGRSSWTQAEAANGIQGTLKQWLACAGIDLDSSPQFHDGSGSVPPALHFRTMGLQLRLVLKYLTDHPSATGGKVVCVVRVLAEERWTYLPVVHDRMYIPVQDSAVVVERLQIAYGVSVTTAVEGRYRTWNGRTAVQAVLELFVLFQIPLFIIRFVALYLLGSVSKMYRRARSTRFNIYSNFHCGIARMLMAEVGFRGLMGGMWTEKIAGNGVCLDILSKHISDLLYDQLRNRILKHEDIHRIAGVVMTHMTDRSGREVSCGDFVRAVSHDDTFDMDLITEVLKELQQTTVTGGLFQNAMVSNSKALRRSLDNVDVDVGLRDSQVPSESDWPGDDFAEGNEDDGDICSVHSGDKDKCTENNAYHSSGSKTSSAADAKLGFKEVGCNASELAPNREPPPPSNEPASEIWSPATFSTVANWSGASLVEEPQASKCSEAASSSFFTGSGGHESGETNKKSQHQLSKVQEYDHLHSLVTRQELEVIVESIKKDLQDKFELEVRIRLAEAESAIEQRLLCLEAAFLQSKVPRTGQQHSRSEGSAGVAEPPTPRRVQFTEAERPGLEVGSRSGPAKREGTPEQRARDTAHRSAVHGSDCRSHSSKWASRTDSTSNPPPAMTMRDEHFGRLLYDGSLAAREQPTATSMDLPSARNLEPGSLARRPPPFVIDRPLVRGTLIPAACLSPGRARMASGDVANVAGRDEPEIFDV